jgi:hypothetical protein
MGCLCNLKPRDENIPASVFAPVILLAGLVGLFVDYLNLGPHALWWYGGASAAGLVATILCAPRWKRSAFAADGEVAKTK